MMRIDLRYLIPVGAFYVPTLALSSLFWMIGIPWTPEVKAVLAFAGAVGGCVCVAISLMLLFDSTFGRDPIWLNLGRKGDDE